MVPDDRTPNGFRTADPSQRRLIAAGWFFAFGSVVHVIDHMRRGQGSVSDELHWAGNLALVLQVVVVLFIVTRHRLAPPVAAIAGLALAAGFTAAHWLPRWSALSDPVWEIETARWFSYLASSLEILGALAVALAGFAVIRRHGLPSPSLQHPRAMRSRPDASGSAPPIGSAGSAPSARPRSR